jgi:SAM-dependent methyltransferase
MSYSVYFAPLALRLLQGSGPLRRTYFGFTLQLLLSATASANFHPCLQVASLCFVALVAGRLKQPAWGATLLLGSVLLSVSTLLTGRHDPRGILLGIAFGWIVYRASFSQQLDFLDASHPWATLRHLLKELRNLWLPNRRAWWERSYAAGEWDFLHSRDQRPRYYTIAGLVQDRFPQGAAVLDVGCGHAILYPLLEKSASSYTGIDFADAAITTCRARFAGESRCVFHTVAFEEYTPEKGFDVVILNEILPYFPLASLARIFAHALTLLKDDQSLLVISLCRNHKAWLVGRKLSRLATPEQCIRVSNVWTGSYWTVSVYRKASSPDDSAASTERAAGRKRRAWGR